MIVVKKKKKHGICKNVFGMHIIAKWWLENERKKITLESPWVIISLKLFIFPFFCWEKKIASYLYNYVNKSDRRFHVQPGFEYAAVTLDPPRAPCWQIKTLLTSHLQDRRQTTRKTDVR